MPKVLLGWTPFILPVDTFSIEVQECLRTVLVMHDCRVFVPVHPRKASLTRKKAGAEGIPCVTQSGQDYYPYQWLNSIEAGILYFDDHSEQILIDRVRSHREENSSERANGGDPTYLQPGACLDCGVDPSFRTGCGHDYMVHDEIWHQAVPDGHGALCLFCLSARLRRPLVLDDFAGTPLQVLHMVLENGLLRKPPCKSMAEAVVIEPMLHERGSFGFGATISRRQRQQWRGLIRRYQKEIRVERIEDGEVNPEPAQAEEGRAAEG